MKKGELWVVYILLIILLVIQAYAVNYYVQEDLENGGNFTTLEGCLLVINSTLNACKLNQSNTAYIFNTTYSGGFYFNQTGANGNIVLSFDKIVQNVTIDFNNSYFESGGRKWLSGFIYVGNLEEDKNVNITIRNFTSSVWNNTLYFDKGAYNFTIENINITNSTTPIIFGVDSLISDFIVRNINIYNNSRTGIKIIKIKNLLLQNINSSGNGVNQLVTENQAYGNITIRDSFFYDNGMGTDCVLLQDQNISFINNTVKYCNTNDKVGVKTATNVTNLKFENNTISENSLNMYISNTNNSVFRGNKFGATYDTNFLNVGFGGSIGFVTDYYDNLVINNTFRDQVDTGITLTMTGNKIGANISITQNRFYNTSNGNHLKDIYVHDLGQGYPNNVTVWLNHFYGPNGTNMNGALNVDFCVGNEGNFYNESIPIHTGSINETDCGLMNLTQPDGFNTIINGSYNLQWKKQSAMTDKTINYSIYYRSANASTWKYLNSTTELSYTWNLASVNDSNDYLVKIIPFDGEYNGTNDNSTHTFTIDNTDPTLTLSPASGTSLDLGATKEISCSASDSLGIGSFSLTVDGSNFGTCSGSSCSDIYTMGDTNSKTVLCSTTDNSGRANSKSIIFSYLGGSGGGGAGGGGGGGSVSETISVTEEEPAVTEQPAGQDFNIMVNGVNYEAKVTQINVVSITANIAGKNIELVIGESKELDLNDDKINDVLVTLDGIKNGNAELTIKLKEKIVEEKPAEVTEEKISVFYEAVNKLYANISIFLSEIFSYIINLFKDVAI